MMSNPKTSPANQTRDLGWDGWGPGLLGARCGFGMDLRFPGMDHPARIRTQFLILGARKYCNNHAALVDDNPGDETLPELAGEAADGCQGTVGETEARVNEPALANPALDREKAKR
jgi:hypothetical protein